MNFVDLRFWTILATCLIVLLPLRTFARRFPWGQSRNLDLIALGITSLMLFYRADALSFLIHAVQLSVTYALLSGMENASSAKRHSRLVLVVVLAMLPLAYYKYAGFLANDVFGLAVSLAARPIPAGISFYSFQLVALAIDTSRRGMALPRLIEYINFTTFFPQVVAGPIERRDSLLPQLAAVDFRMTLARLVDGIPILTLGLFYKLVLADNIAPYIIRDYSPNAYAIWLASILFGLRIYFDFAGYSLIAVGLARWFNIRLTYNFLAPYSSRNVREFWHRWHISLSTWFRDYLYVPLGGNRRGNWAFNILVVFVISGIWHGAGWNFVLWGALHGLLLVGLGWLGKTRFALPGILAWAVTYLAVTFLWLFFYETRTDVLLQKLACLGTPHAYALANLRSMPSVYYITDLAPAIIMLLAGIAMIALECRFKNLAVPYAPLFDFRVTIGLAVLLVLAAARETSQFLYFAF